MKVTFSSIDYKAGLKETNFKLEDYIKEMQDAENNTINNK